MVQHDVGGEIGDRRRSQPGSVVFELGVEIPPERFRGNGHELAGAGGTAARNEHHIVPSVDEFPIEQMHDTLDAAVRTRGYGLLER
jgi:hypothetical protein